MFLPLLIVKRGERRESEYIIECWIFRFVCSEVQQSVVELSNDLYQTVYISNVVKKKIVDNGGLVEISIGVISSKLIL